MESTEQKLEKLRQQRAEIVARSPANRVRVPNTPTASLKSASEAAIARFSKFSTQRFSDISTPQRLNHLEQRIEASRKFQPRDIVDPFDSSDDEFIDAKEAMDNIDLDELLLQEKNDTIERILREGSVTLDYTKEPTITPLQSIKPDVAKPIKPSKEASGHAQEWIVRAKSLMDIGYEQGAVGVLREALRRNVEPRIMIQDFLDDLIPEAPSPMQTRDDDVITKKTTSVRVTIQGSPRTADQLIHGKDSRINLVHEMAKMLQNMNLEKSKPKKEVKSEFKELITPKKSKEHPLASHSPIVQLEDGSKSGSMTVLTPVRVTAHKDRTALGTESVLTPVRRSVRTNENVPVEMEQLLESVDYAYAPNKVHIPFIFGRIYLFRIWTVKHSCPRFAKNSRKNVQTGLLRTFKQALQSFNDSCQ
jgi:hypothetical protein